MKLIIVAPHFPPSSLPPSQRVRLMMPHLKKMGVTTTVFTTPAKYREENEDPWMLELAGKDYELIEVKSFSFHWTRKFGVGDLGLRMLPFLIFKLRKHCKKNRVDFILYPVPPWYILLIAPIIKRLSGVPYGIDFIDPWVSGDTDKLKNTSVKRRLSQWIARKLEGMVCRNASIIYAVSVGINQELLKRNPSLNTNRMYAIPYGAEEKDFSNASIRRRKESTINIRYIGAVWPDAYPVIESLLTAFKEIKLDYKLEFYGTSYAGESLAKPQLESWVNSLGMHTKVFEYPNRVPYQEAVKLNMESDILLLFGGMQAYYAASKLFGLIVSKKPFLAFLHRDSFPAKFLKSFNYPYLVEYSQQKGDLPKENQVELKILLEKCLNEFANFTPLNLEDERIQKHTAFGMTKSFIDPINELLNERLYRNN